MNWFRSSMAFMAAIIFAGTAHASASPTVYRHGDVTSDKVALTFDDGPHAGYTDEILDILAQNDVKATFFVIGENARQHQASIAREINEGHEIGIHTYTHCNICRCKGCELTDEVLRCEETLGEYCPRLFRPPEGKYNASDVQTLSDMGYDTVLWSIDTRDWTGASSQQIISAVRKNIKGGDIILFHDYNSGKSGTPDALRVLIPELKDHGFELVTVSELLHGEL